MNEKELKLTGISLITIQIQLIPAGCRLYPVVPLNRIHPPSPPTALLRLRPTAIRLEHTPHSDYPRRDLDVDKRDGGPEKKWTGDIRSVD